MRRLAEQLNTGKHSVDHPTLLRVSAAALAILSFLVPWTTLDGASSPISASSLIAMSFTNAEATLLFDVAFLPSFALFAIPAITAPLAVYTAATALLRKNLLPPSLIALVLALSFSPLTTAVVSSNTPQILGVNLPGPGLFLFIVTNLFLVVHSVWGPDPTR